MNVAGRRLCAVLLLLATSMPASAAVSITAVSTSLLPSSEGGECEWRENAFADEDAFLCPGAGGFRVYVRSGGIDSWPAFARGREVSDLRAGLVRVTGADVVALTGTPMEWRMAAGRPVAVIFQVHTERDVGGEGAGYIIARIAADRVCVAGQAASEAAARRIADGGGGCH